MEVFKRKKKTLKASVTRLEHKIQTKSEDSEAELELLLMQGSEISQNLEELQQDLYKLSGVEEKEFDILQDELLDVKERIQIHLVNIRLAEKERMKDFTAINSTKATPHSSVKLPILELPHFSGELEDWIKFKETFEVTIHQNLQLSAVEKLQYLRSMVKGPALSVINCIPISEQGYEEARRLLHNRFDNHKEIVYANLEKLTSQPVITTESSVLLRRLVDTSQEVMGALKILNLPIHHWDAFLVFTLKRKLDSETLRQWELSNPGKDLPNMTTFMQFLENRANSLATISQKTTQSSTKFKGTVRATTCQSSVHSTTIREECPCCKGNHAIYTCSEFLKMPIIQRREFIKNKRRCFNCLKDSHLQRQCTARSCKTCQQKHNSLLHLNIERYDTTDSAKPNVVNNCLSVINQTILPTALLKISDAKGYLTTCRSLLDTGSQTSFITSACVQRLRLRRYPGELPFYGITASKINRAKGFVNISIMKQDGHFLKVKAFVMPRIIGQLPKIDNTIIGDCKLSDTLLADPSFMLQGNIDVLLGSDVLAGIFTGEMKAFSDTQPNIVLLGSVVGWVIMGSSENSSINPTIACYSCCDINETLKKMWSLEDIPLTDDVESSTSKCEQLFKSTHYRLKSGRYVVRLPFISENKHFPSSREVAVKRLMQTEFRSKHDTVLQQKYQKFMTEYLQDGHMERIASTEAHAEDSECCYIPHHAVNRHAKFRVVFDASAKYSNNCSLNDKLLVGPTIQENLFTLLLNFRMHPIAISADIAKMYRQILISKEDVNYQRIVWRISPEHPIEDFRLLTVTYGTSSAPFLATRCLKQLSLDEADCFPRASRVIKKHFYVDNLLSGTQTPQEAVSLTKELITMLERGGFQLRKWASNSKLVMKSIPKDWHYHESLLSFDKDISVKTLGVHWRPNSDQFTFKMMIPSSDDKCTKRAILSHIATIFDPLGWLSPITVTAKIILQETWKQDLGWDETLPEELATRWSQYLKGLNAIEQITIPRCITKVSCHTYKLVGFSDASMKAYTACIYLVPTGGQTENKVHLIAARTKVAPIRVVSLPRLELSAALLLTQLMGNIDRVIEVSIVKRYAFTDSKIVLAWLVASPKRWKPFVAHRVQKIQASIPHDCWNYVKSQENPADLATRGITSTYLLQCSLWWSGPKWLVDSNFPLKEENCSDKHLIGRGIELEEKICEANCVALSTVSKGQNDRNEIWQRYSSLNRLVRILAYCFRFAQNTRLSTENKIVGFLTSHEITNALHKCVKLAQMEAFTLEFSCLRFQRPLPKNSRLIKLNPFLDEKELIRAGGRLLHAKVNFDKKYPIVLPKVHILTHLIIDCYHQRHLHAGPQLLQAVIQNQFWIISIRDAIKRYLQKCLICLRLKAQVVQQQMGNLPSARINPAKPFLHCRIDYAGPFTLRVVKCPRGRKTYKGYIALFICFVTRAIHLELVSDLTTDACIAAIKRFTARRGICQTITSDCGTNFVGTARELREFFQLINSSKHKEKMQHFLSEKNIEWVFNPPGAPHMGGLWEAGIKSMKYHLRRIISDTPLNYEEFSTILTQVEACLNSRPLSPMSNDPNDLTSLTPAHFLTGDSLCAIPEPNHTTLQISHLSRWQLTQRMVQHFWKRWSNEYLSRLQQRPKWWAASANTNVGNLVLLKESSLPPLKWRLGRIVETYPGEDNLIRVVLIKTTTGLMKRHVSKLILLPFDKSDSVSSTHVDNDASLAE